MKSLIVLSIALVSFSSFGACIPDRYVKICRGDKVVAGNSQGEVVGINSIALRVAIMFEFGKNHLGVGAYDVEVVALAKGCLSGICVGDRVLVGNAESLVVGINPLTRNVSHRAIDDISGREIKPVKLGELTVTKMIEAIDVHNPLRYTSNLNEFNANF